MPSGYPAAIDNFTNPTAVNNLNDAPVLHHSQHTNVNDAVKAIETELGTNPKGVSATVKDRLVAIEASVALKANSALLNAASGIATLDAGLKLVQEVDASKLTSGTLPNARLLNIPGAKIQGPTGGGSDVPLDAIPDLPASQTTSGTFTAARIPPLDASVIATGTIAAARLPASATANANALPVADIAARDAIPLGSRVNGMLVFVEGTKQLFEWQSAGSIWNLVGAGMDSEISATTWLNANFTAFGPGTYPPLRVWFNTTTRRLTTEIMVTRTTNSASATVHSPLIIPSQYRAAFYTSGPVITNIGGTEKAVRCTVLNTTGSVDIVLPAAAIWTASTHWVNVAISWVVPLP